MTLRWCEPYRDQGGWMGSNYDTGLCNRIFHWELADIINKKNDYSYTIQVEGMYWPECKLITLPNTEPILSKKDLYGNYTFTKGATAIPKSEIHRMFKEDSFKLGSRGHYYSDFGWTVLKHLQLHENIEVNPRPLTKIKLIHKPIEDIIRESVKGVVGIHMRRHNGVYKTQEDRKSLPVEVRTKLPATIQNKDSIYYMEYSDYTFHRDELYFNVIDNMLRLNPDQKFYLSCDLPYELVSYYYTKYSRNMINKDEIIDKVYAFLESLGYTKKDFAFGNTVENLVDLFSLSFCDFLIKSPPSTWSEFAELYQPKPAVEVTDDWNICINEKYSLYLNKKGKDEELSYLD